ncbi:MAG TPA: vWA domain-containing protein [Rhodothermales bacterium]|nr:vWA domain-containing protein [Rhodothermales bacterium]
MRTDLTEIICIIDRSGSMQSIRSDAIGGFNAFLEGQQKHPGEGRLTLALFNHDYERVYENTPLPEVPPLTEDTYVPEGTTALLDAVGRTLVDVGKRLAATPEAERPAQVIVAILTDGLENASTDYTRERIAEMIAHQRTKYAWEFIFLAANQNAFQAAQKLSIDPADAMPFASTKVGVRAAYANLTENVSQRRSRKKS